MKFKLEIKTDNEAFYSCNGFEIARILRSLASNIDRGVVHDPGSSGKLFDINGNSVGHWKVTK